VRGGLKVMSDNLGEQPFCMGIHYTLADVAVGCTLGWLAFRFPEIDWRGDYPNLARLFDKLSERPSFRDTEQGFDMLVSRVDAEQLDAAGAPFDTGRVIGVVLIGQWRHHDQLNQLAARHVPVVVWGAQLPQQLYCTVGGDNLAGGELAGAHLLAQGRKRIAFFGDINLPEIGHRYDGLCKAQAAAGIAVDPALLIPASFVPDGGRLAVEELLRREVPFDAVFAGSDLMAMTAINTFRQLGIDVPDRVAVVGYDDIELASYFHPPLTTVRQPVREAGRALVASLLELTEGRAAPSLQLPTQLIIRSSSV
jgi:DNA-binding LacI/PurR family transcriptional regulator